MSRITTKAKARDNKQQCAERKFAYKLTVGMIVKNEENNLRTCLTALRPLVEAVGGQIIVTDTGSTDGTVAIAEELADRVLHVEWKDDFAAARNSVWPYVNSEWFMFLDADEILDRDISEAVQFFKSNEDKRYQSAAICIRNYFESRKDGDFGDFYPVRLHRVGEGLAFSGVIHESIPFEYPVKKLKLVAHHSGYVGMENGEKEEKVLRNRRILENLPIDSRRLIELADTYPTDMDKRIEYLERACHLADQETEQLTEREYRRVAAYVRLCREYYRYPDCKKRGELIATIEEYWAGKKTAQDYSGETELLMYAGQYWAEQEEPQRVIDNLMVYDRLYRKAKEGKLDTVDIHSVSSSGLHGENYDRLMLLMVKSFVRLQQWKQAEKVLSQLNLHEIAERGGLSNYLWTEFFYASESKDIGRLPGVYENIRQYPEGRQIYWEALGKVFPPYFKVDNRDELYGLLGEIEGDDPCLALCRLYRSEKAALDDEFLERLLMAKACSQQPLYAEVLYWAVCREKPLSLLCQSIEADKLFFLVDLACKVRMDFPALLLDWIQRSGDSGEIPLHQLFWRIHLTADGLIALCELERSESMVSDYFRRVSEDLKQLVTRTYRAEALAPEMESVLPELYRAGIHASCGLDAQKKGDVAEYVRQLKEVAACHPAFSKPVKRLLNMEEKKLQAEAAAQDEFQALAGQIKEQISSLVLQGRNGEAADVLTAYGSINPGDPALAELAALVHSGKGTEGDRLQ